MKLESLPLLNFLPIFLPPLLVLLQSVPAGQNISQLGQDGQVHGQNLSQLASSVPAQALPPQQSVAQAAVHQQLQSLQISNNLPPTHTSQVLSDISLLSQISQQMPAYFPHV